MNNITNTIFDIDSSANKITLEIPSNTYTTDTYVENINPIISDFNVTTVNSKNPNGIFNLNNTRAFINNETKLEFRIDINKIFDISDFNVDVSNTLYDINYTNDNSNNDFTLNANDQLTIPSDNDIIDLSSNNTITNSFNIKSQGYKLKKDKPVAMFCTGGIRCEKTAVYLKKKGFNNIFQLNGGILNYLKKINTKESLWKGECFVFDNRISLKHGLKVGTYFMCSGCRKPISPKDKKSKKYEEGVSCPNCYNNLTETQKSRFRMRQKQINLAKKSGSKHIFQKEFK